ncbi:MAG: hydroxymethylbilane synthase [Flavisolibacter sp.]
MSKIIRIGTRDSQLAVWQATLVQDLLKKTGVASELVYIKSEGDIDTVTPLYAIGVTGVFTKTLDAALLNKRIDIAVHSMKDVPVQLASGIRQAAVLERASHKDIFVPHPDIEDVHSLFGGRLSGNQGQSTNDLQPAIIATSSVRRIAQWKNRFSHHTIENLRGNVNTRLRKLKESNWSGAIFAAAGLERIGLRPSNAVDLDWMLPAPAQGAIMIVCREEDQDAFNACLPLNHEATALCTSIERDFLSGLMGGCSTPISAFAQVKDDLVYFKGNIASPDGTYSIGCNGNNRVSDAEDMGTRQAQSLLNGEGNEQVRHLLKKLSTKDGEV